MASANTILSINHFCPRLPHLPAPLTSSSSLCFALSGLREGLEGILGPLLLPTCMLTWYPKSPAWPRCRRPYFWAPTLGCGKN